MDGRSRSRANEAKEPAPAAELLRAAQEEEDTEEDVPRLLPSVLNIWVPATLDLQLDFSTFLTSVLPVEGAFSVASRDGAGLPISTTGALG